MDLTSEEKDAIEADIKRVKPEDEPAVREGFQAKYEQAAPAAQSTRFRVLLNVRCLYEMLVDPDYALPWETKAAIIFALGYFISPIDAIPDALPVIGYVDDALVVGFVVHKLSSAIVEYRRFRRENGRSLPDI